MISRGESKTILSASLINSTYNHMAFMLRYSLQKGSAKQQVKQDHKVCLEKVQCIAYVSKDWFGFNL